MKLILWALLGIGLIPCVFMLLQGGMYLYLLRFTKRFVNFQQGYFHDYYHRIEIGGMSCEIYPRTWAFFVLALGITAIVVAFIFLLHFPKPDSVAL